MFSFEKSTLPRITIITATYNAGSELPGLVKSIRSQCYENIQWIVADNTSTDKTVSVLESASDVVSKWMSHPDEGIYDAWNKCLDFVDGDWVLFLGADDRLASSHVLLTVARVLATLPLEIQWAYGQVRQHGRNGATQWFGQDWEQVRDCFNAVMVVPHQAVFHRRGLLERMGGFDPHLKIAGDYKMLLSALQQGNYPKFFPVHVVDMGGNGVSSIPENNFLALREFASARRSLGIKTIYPWKWCWHYCKAAIKVVLYSVLGAAIGRHCINWYRVTTGRVRF